MAGLAVAISSTAFVASDRNFMVNCKSVRSGSYVSPFQRRHSKQRMIQ